LTRLRTLTGGFTPPADACTTYRLCYGELERFERDLHQHVHLENNVLFPRALALEPRPA
jgi:regulator of cell morphogenesis and NO signaling